MMQRQPSTRLTLKAKSRPAGASATDDVAQPPSHVVVQPPPAEDRVELSDAVRSLSEHLGELQGFLRELAELSRAKLGAMRQADTETLTATAEREAGLLEGVFQLERRRPALLARIAQCLQVSPDAVKTISALADRLGEPHASAIRARAHALVRFAEDLRRMNKLAAMVARDLQGHIRGVFASVSEAGSENVGYDPRGQERRTKPTAWLDAVG